MFNGYTGESSKPRLLVHIYIYPGIQGGFIWCFYSCHLIVFLYFIRTSPAMLMLIYPGKVTRNVFFFIYYLVKPELDKGIDTKMRY